MNKPPSSNWNRFYRHCRTNAVSAEELKAWLRMELQRKGGPRPAMIARMTGKWKKAAVQELLDELEKERDA